jgi:bifunctional DNA-binding transcriptional regulator/antitoxin component of YhaV-PrlF toxin-antitoxin module
MGIETRSGDKGSIGLIIFIPEANMDNTMTIQMTQAGDLVLPKSLREAYNLQPGDSVTLLDLGGVFMVSPHHSEIDVIANRISKELQDKGESLESMLGFLREEREIYVD